MLLSVTNAKSMIVSIPIYLDDFAVAALHAEWQMRADALHRRTRRFAALPPLPRPQMPIGRNPIAPLPRRCTQS